MKIVKEPKKIVATYWGMQSRKDTEYRLIQYQIREQCGDDSLLLNTVTGELVLLSEEEVGVLKQLPGKVPSYADELIRHHFLVPVDFDEKQSVNQLRLILKKIKKASTNITGYSILPTTGCNARCFYCFESNYPKISMTEKVAEQTVKFIEANHGGKKIWISWFGGEPMLGHNRISQICDLLTQKGIEYRSSMYSNGSLFTKELSKIASEKWHLRQIQITLDGSEEVYNKTKSYIGFSDSPYYRVLDNIGDLLDQGIRVIVRLNMDFYNSDDLPKIIDELSERYGGRNNFSMYVHELFEDEGFDPVHHSREEQKMIEAERVRLEAYIVEKGCNLATKTELDNGGLPALRYISCMADNPGSVLINPIGQIGKCDHYSFQHLVGNIYNNDNEFDQNELHYWMYYDILPECKECVLSPFCAKPVTCDAGNGCRSEISQSRIIDIKNRMKNIYLKSVQNNKK